MNNRKQMEDEVQDMRNQLSDSDKTASGTQSSAGTSGTTGAAGSGASGETDNGEQRFFDQETREQWRNFTEAQGVAAEELRSVGDQLLTELRDMPSRKPLTTILAAFLLGIFVGRR